MSEENWQWVTVEDAIAAHEQGIAYFGGSYGIRDGGGLESALAYPMNLAAYGEPGLADLAAGYLFALAKNHPFVDGNKRTAWQVMRLFVRLNGGEMNCDEAEAVAFVVEVASDVIDRDGARDWIAARLTHPTP